MSLKSRFFFSFTFSILVAVGLGATLLLGFYQGQGLFDSINHSFQVRQAVRDADYFFLRYNQLLMYYVMFQDDADKMYIYEMQDDLVDRLNKWEKLVEQGWGPKADLAEVKIRCQRLFFLRFQILNMVDHGQRPAAIERVRKIYLPASSQAEEKIRLAGRHLDNDSRGMTGELAAVIKRSRTLFRFGALFSFLLFVIFVRDIRRSTVLPAARAAPVPRPVDENRPIGTGL